MATSAKMMVEAIEEAVEEALTGEPRKPKSVVPYAFKRKYTEKGDATCCGDDVATVLKQFKPHEVVRYAVEAGLVKEGQYAHLNPGMQRMNCGNRLRGHLRNLDVSLTFKFGPLTFQGQCTEAAD